jgi:hypothetical protein
MSGVVKLELSYDMFFEPLMYTERICAAKRASHKLHGILPSARWRRTLRPYGSESTRPSTGMRRSVFIFFRNSLRIESARQSLCCAPM